MKPTREKTNFENLRKTPAGEFKLIRFAHSSN